MIKKCKLCDCYHAPERGCPPQEEAVSNSAFSGGLVAPWDYLEGNPDDHFANYYAWEKWLQTKDRNDSLQDLDMMEKTLLYAIMIDLVKQT